MKKIVFPVFIIWGKCFLIAVFVLSLISEGQTLAEQKLQTIQKLEKKDSRISSLITSTISKMKSIGVTRENAVSLRTSSLSNPLVKVDDSGNIQTYIYVQDANKENLSKLESMNVKIEIVNTKYNLIQAWIPFDKVEEVANLSFVKKITPPSYGKLRAGSITSEGDAVIHSDEVRSDLRFDGSGVEVGVISDGIDHRAASQATGDIPEDIIIGNAGSGDEGTALLEIIHDIAPGAELAFSEGFSSSLAFINSINFLVNTAKVDVIVDDIGFLDEPYFQDGMVAEEVEDAVKSGVVFVSSAGNNADEHYQQFYVDETTGDDSDGINPHDFGAAAGKESDIFMPVLVGGTQFAPNNFIAVILQWNDPFGDSTNDYDLFLLDDEGRELARSDDIQPDESRDPIEIVSFENNTPNNITVNVVINRFSGSPDKTLEMNFNGAIAIEDFNVPSDSVFGHPAAKNAIAVGAVPATNDNFCLGDASGPDEVEDYSSQGPSTIFFPEFEQRQKPDVVAPDGIHITGAGDFGRPDVAGGFVLCGTSGSAPHVAGVAALILSKNPNLTPLQVGEAIKSTAHSLPSILVATSTEKGNLVETAQFSNISGFGIVDAFAAVQSVSSEATPTPTPTPSNGGGKSGGGCAIGGKAEVSQGLSNLLVFLLPVGVLSLKRLKRVFVKSNREIRIK